MEYLNYLKKLNSVITDEGEEVELFELEDCIPESSFNEWANHFRQQYCSDDIIDALVQGTGMTKEEYLLSQKFPDKTNDFGPATRAGDFGELLILDYFEYLLGYCGLRERYKNKLNRNASPQGTDVIAYKILGDKESSNDELIIYEVKTQATKNTSENRLQDAINDSYKDEIRKGETLSAIKQIYIEKGRLNDALRIQRFQNKPDLPYIEKYGAATVQDNIVYSESAIKSSKLNNRKRKLLVIKRSNLMKLIHELYERAAKC